MKAFSPENEASPPDATSMSGIAVTPPVTLFIRETLIVDEESANAGKSKLSRKPTFCSGRKVSPAVRTAGIGF